MKKGEWVLREILHRFYEQEERFMSQKSIAQNCDVSEDTVSRVVNKIHNFKAVEKKPLGFRIIYPQKILLYWASTRGLVKDILYSAYSPDAVSKIEEQMPEDVIFTAHSGYHRKVGSVFTHYEEVYVYTRPEKIKSRFPKSNLERKNVYVLESDPHLKKISENKAPPLPQIYVDLWQIGGRVADKLVSKLEKRFESAGFGTLKSLAQKKKNQFT